MTEYSRQEIIDKIKLWLKEVQGVKVEHVTDKSIPPDYVVLKVSVKGEAPIALLSHEQQLERKIINIEYFIDIPNNSDLLRIMTPFRFDRSANIGFKLLKLEDKVRFNNVMRVPILAGNLGYEWKPDLLNFDYLEISKIMYFDGFSKNSFFDALTGVIRGYEVCLAQYEEFTISAR
ncbi:MAG: hypothetical protein ACRD47_12915 [Nitrososphaeraceae archaeon]